MNVHIRCFVFLQDFCSSESNSIAGEVKVVTEPDHLSLIKEVLMLLNLLHGYVVQGMCSSA